LRYRKSVKGNPTPFGGPVPCSKPLL
jgi:hypothetical protein